jgi:hypothetical protein
MTVTVLMGFPERVALVRIADDGANLAGWERARLAEWAGLAFGSTKQNIIVDRVGVRLYGREAWLQMAGTIHTR